MKILFICGSLEFGRDGVGDYTRKLAAQVIRLGHQASAMALHERNIQSSIIEIQNNEDVSLEVLRIPRIWAGKQRFDTAKGYAEKFAPDWISLQFVPYSFNSKGICFGLGKQLKKLSPGCKWHIMFHELWIGRDVNTRAKEWFVAQLQKIAIKSIGKSILPDLIHTQLPVFYAKLEKFGWEIKRLPLFSNVSMIASNKPVEPGKFTLGFFSQVEVTAPIMAFLDNLAIQLEKQNLKFEIVLIGGTDARMKTLINVFELIANLKGHVKHTGFLQQEGLAEAVQACDMGITPIPRHALGKSGSVAAFISYGIPVAAPIVHMMYNENEIGFFTNELCRSIVIESDFKQWELAKEAANIAKEQIQLSRIAETFLFDLNGKNKIIN